MVKRAVGDEATARASIRERCKEILSRERPAGWSISRTHRATYERHMDRFRFIMKAVSKCEDDELHTYHKRYERAVKGGVNPDGGMPMEGCRCI